MSNVWEMGSSFHDSVEGFTLFKTPYLDFFNNCQLYMSGRHALLDLIKFYSSSNTKVCIPSYYCHDVTNLIEGVACTELYECDPFSVVDLSIFPRRSIVVLVEYFGNPARIKGINNDITILLDKTHDPFTQYNYNFTVNYTFGSLRKVLPIVDGGFLNPPLSSNEDTFAHSSYPLVQEVKEAMLLKKRFLNGEVVDKRQFLEVFSTFEAYLNKEKSPLPISKNSYDKLLKIDIDRIKTIKNDNLEYLYSYYSEKSFFEIFYNKSYFSFLVPNNLLTKIKSSLIKNNIYPIILWPDYEGNLCLLEGSVLLSLHVDFRYNMSDINKLILILDEIFNDL